MSEIKTLLLLELRSLFGINKAWHTKDKKEKARYTFLAFVFLFLILLAFFYVGALVYGLCLLELSSIVPAYLSFISSIVILFFGIFSAGKRIFGGKGYDILISMPIKPSHVVISRFLSMYVGDLFLSLAVLFPGLAVYGYMLRPSAFFYIYAILGSLFIPLIPVVISISFGTAILAISSKMKRKSVVEAVLAVAFVLAIIGLSLFFGGADGGISGDMLKDLAGTVKELIGRIYPFAIFFNSALTEGSLLSLAIFALSSLFAAAAAIFAVSFSFESIIRGLNSRYAKHDYRVGVLSPRGIFKALYIREAKRYFSSSIYVTNTIVGPILAFIMAAALAAVGGESIMQELLEELPTELDIARILPYIFSLCMCMITVSSTSISMEGKGISIIKALPIPEKALYGAKLAFSISLMLPFYLLSLPFLAAAVKASITELLWIILIPLASMIFYTVLGLAVNISFHSFDWEKEETVVKQSLPASICALAGIFGGMGLTALSVILPLEFSHLFNFALVVTLLFSAFLLYGSSNKKPISEL